MEFDVHFQELWQALLDAKKECNIVLTISPNADREREFFHVYRTNKKIPEEDATRYSASISGLNNLLISMNREGYEDPQIVAQEMAPDFFILTYKAKK